jgi:hypothetical protein
MTVKGGWGYKPLDINEFVNVIKKIKGKFILSFENNEKFKDMIKD